MEIKETGFAAWLDLSRLAVRADEKRFTLAWLEADFFVIIQDIIFLTPNRWIMDCQEVWNAFLGMSLLFICFVCRFESWVKSCHKSFFQMRFGNTVIRMSALLSCWVMSSKVSWLKGKFQPKLKHFCLYLLTPLSGEVSPKDFLELHSKTVSQCFSETTEVAVDGFQT